MLAVEFKDSSAFLGIDTVEHWFCTEYLNYDYLYQCVSNPVQFGKISKHSKKMNESTLISIFLSVLFIWYCSYYNMVSSVTEVYRWVIEDVINNVRQEFVNEANEDVLHQLQTVSYWSLIPLAPIPQPSLINTIQWSIYILFYRPFSGSSSSSSSISIVATSNQSNSAKRILLIW